LQKVSIESQGRCGTVTYREAGHQLVCHWEFGGNDVVAIVYCGSAADWARHPWTQGRRAEILQCIADEVVRQQAPACRAEIDAHTGHVLLRQAGAASIPTGKPLMFGLLGMRPGAGMPGPDSGGSAWRNLPCRRSGTAGGARPTRPSRRLHRLVVTFVSADG
jgi:hypothetical protein